MTAKVRGSINPYFGVYKEPIYTTTVSLAADLSQGLAACHRRSLHQSELRGKAAAERDAGHHRQRLRGCGRPSAPRTRGDLATDCSCPDWSNPCKHIAGVYYLLACDLDSDPFLLFELRGMSRERLMKQLSDSPLGRILAEGMTKVETPIEESDSLFTIPAESPPPLAISNSSGKAKAPSAVRTSPPRPASTHAHQERR